MQAADARARSAAASRRRKISPRISSVKIGCDAGSPASGCAGGEDIARRRGLVCDGGEDIAQKPELLSPTLVHPHPLRPGLLGI